MHGLHKKQDWTQYPKTVETKSDFSNILCTITQLKIKIKDI